MRWSRVDRVPLPDIAPETEAKKARYAALPDDAARRRFIGARLLLQLTVAETLGCAPQQVTLHQHCAKCGGAHGRPTVEVNGAAGPEVTMSSSNDLAIVAIAKRPVGIDIEHTAPGRRPESAAAIELTTWVRTEAVLKATGHGLTVDPALVRISPPGDLPRLLGWKGPGRFPVLRMADLKTDPGYLVSLAVIGRGRLRVDLGRMELADRPAVDVKELGVRAVAARQ